MSVPPTFDFWYAVNNTEVLRAPKQTLATFGQSLVSYTLLAETMDDTSKVRVREGRVEVYRPEILTPQSMAETLMENFGPEAERYVEWLRGHQAELTLLRYGFAIRKQETSDETVSDSLRAVTARVQEALERKDDPMSALLVGVEEPWEVCLVKLMVDVVQRSVAGNLAELREDPGGDGHAIEAAFREAQRDRRRLGALHDELQKRGLFDRYQDRFFALVRSGR